MKILTIRQPWAQAIITGGKDIENRSWATHYRGTVAIHAGLTVDTSPAALAVPSLPSTLIERGAIIGTVDIIDVVQDSTSEWALGELFHWVLANPQPITPIPHTGALGLRHLDDAIAEKIQVDLAACMLSEATALSVDEAKFVAETALTRFGLTEPSSEKDT